MTTLERTYPEAARDLAGLRQAASAYEKMGNQYEADFRRAVDSYVLISFDKYGTDPRRFIKGVLLYLKAQGNSR